MKDTHHEEMVFEEDAVFEEIAAIEIEEPIEDLLPIHVEETTVADSQVANVTDEGLALYNEVLATIGEAEPLFEDTEEENKKNAGSDPDIFGENESILLQSPITVEGNFIYCMEPNPQGFDVKKRISNFSLTPLYLIEQENDNVSYYVTLKNQHGTKRIIIDGETLSSNRLFKAFCRNKGAYNWSGTQKQLDHFNDYFIATYDIPVVHEANYMGYQIDLESHRPQDPETMKDHVWLFPTHAFYNGQLIYPDDDGIIRTPTKNYLLNQRNFANFSASVAPIQLEPTKDEILNLLSHAHILYDNYLWLGIGYMMATQQVSTIAKHTNQFPYFYPAGVRHSGKTDYMNFITKFSGINATLNNPPERLDVFRKQIGFHSHLPFGYDETQDQAKNGRTIGFFDRFLNELKTMFNRKLLERGDKDPSKIHRFPIRASLTFSGEVATTESAIRSRTVIVDSTNFHHDLQSYNEVAENEDLMLWLGQYMMKQAHEWRPLLLEELQRFNEFLKADKYKHILSRVRKNYAILASGASVFMKILDEQFGTRLYTRMFELGFLDFLLTEMNKSQAVVEEEQHCVTFLKNIAHLANKGFLRNNAHYIIERATHDRDSQPLKMYLAPSEAWNALQESKLTTTYNATNQISSDLEQFNYFVKEKKGMQKKISGKTYRVWVFDLTADNLPEFFQHFMSPDWEYQQSVHNDYEQSRYGAKY